MYIIGLYSVLSIMEATCSNADTDKDNVNFLSDESSLSVEYVCLVGFAQLENFSLIWKGHHDHAGLSDTYTRGYTYFISSDRKKCFQQKLNQQIFNAIIRLFTYSILILIVKSGNLIDKNA